MWKCLSQSKYEVLTNCLLLQNLLHFFCYYKGEIHTICKWASLPLFCFIKVSSRSVFLSFCLIWKNFFVLLVYFIWCQFLCLPPWPSSVVHNFFQLNFELVFKNTKRVFANDRSSNRSPLCNFPEGTSCRLLVYLCEAWCVQLFGPILSCLTDAKGQMWYGEFCPVCPLPVQPGSSPQFCSTVFGMFGSSLEGNLPAQPGMSSSAKCTWQVQL